VLKLSKLTDYGMILMSHMASSGQQVWKAADLAARTSLPAPTVSKILQSLLQRRLLRSQRGAHGGYRLARDPAFISVREVVDALEGEIALTECNSDHGCCEQQHSCTMRGSWMRINEAMRELLASITLAEMAQEEFLPRFSRIPSHPISIHHQEQP